jgi:hypothetical protein
MFSFLVVEPIHSGSNSSFLVMEPIHPGSNSRFDMCVTYLQLIILSVVGDIIVDSDALLVTDSMNLKFKSTQSFECAHMDRVCVRVFIEKNTCIYISIYVYTVFLKKMTWVQA